MPPMPRGSLRCGRKKYSSHHALRRAIVGDGGVLVASELHGLVKGGRVGVHLASPAVEDRGQVGATAEPLAGRHHHAGVHVDCRHVGVPRVGDQRDAARPEARILVGAGDLLAELRRELAEDGGGVDADLLEDTAVHHRHDAAAAMIAVALPGAPLEAAGRPRGLGTGQIVLEPLQRRADAVAQGLEPGARLVLPGFDVGGEPRGNFGPVHRFSVWWSDAAAERTARARGLVFSGGDP